MQLFLVQHGLSLSREENSLRPLSEVGRRENLKMGRFLKQQAQIKLSWIFHSSKCRAKETASDLAILLNPVFGINEKGDLEPEADPMIWKRKVDNYNENIMIVGHLPHIQSLAGLILYSDYKIENLGKYIHFQNSGCLCLEKEENNKWFLKWLIVPRILK